jgi:hypothetical protein
MSETDPYAAPDAPNTEEAAVPTPAPVVAPVEAVEAPVTEEQTVPEGSIKDVLGWVGEDPTKAKAALDAEASGEKRKTLVKELNAILDK